MRNWLTLVICFSLVAVLASPCSAQERTYKIDVLQVRDIPPYQYAYQGFLDELKKNGFEEGKNLTVNRHIVPLSKGSAGVWQKLRALVQIRKEASRVADEKPDLVLTIGTSATYYAKSEMVDASIPVVFTAVADPTAVGCKSIDEAGPGFTGATEYIDMKDMLMTFKQVFPVINRIGIVYSDSINAKAEAKSAKKVGKSLGITVITKEVSSGDHITPAAKGLLSKGVQAFVIPLDTYYAIRNYESCKELFDLCSENKIPVISFALVKYPGAVLYMGADFTKIGMLSAQQAVKILKDNVKPETLPILRQEVPTIMVDEKALKSFNMQLPQGLQDVAKPLE